MLPVNLFYRNLSKLYFNSYLQKAIILCSIFSLLVFSSPLLAGKHDNETMKAIVIRTFGKPDVLEVKEVPIPTIGKKQVLIQVKAAGINPVDAYMRSGTCPVLPRLPAILGKEISGLIDEVDPTVNNFKEGDRVFCGINEGGYAEYAVANASDCYPLSESLSFAQGSALYTTYFSVYRGIVMKGHLTRGKALLIHGAVGFVGVAAVQIAKELGVVVVASVKSQPSEKLMQQCKVDHIAYHTDENYLDEALKKVRKRRFDVILELLPGFDLYFDRKYLDPDGRIIILGSRLPDKRNARNTYVISYFKYAEEDQKEASEFLLDAIEVGSIWPVIAAEYKFEDASKAHYHLAYDNAEKGKVVFVV